MGVLQPKSKDYFIFVRQFVYLTTLKFISDFKLSHCHYYAYDA